MTPSNQIKNSEFSREFQINGVRIIVASARSVGICVYDKNVQHYIDGDVCYLVYLPRIRSFKSVNKSEFKSARISFDQHFGGSLINALIHERLQNIAEHYITRKNEAIQQYLSIRLPPGQFGPDGFLDRFKPSAFFHFTDTRNIPSISEHGLCSLSEIERLNIKVAAYGGDEVSRKIDREKRLDHFVRLCFYASHDLEMKARKYDRRIDKSVFISVSPEILKSYGVIFTPAVAYSKGCPLLSLSQAIEVMDFQAIYGGLDLCDPAINMRVQLTRKYEILVPNLILPEYLTFPSHG